MSALKVILVVSHTIFWLMVGLRVTASRRRGGNAPAPEGSGIGSSRATLAIAFVTITMSMYYVVLIAWWVRPTLAGPLVLPSSWLFELIGVATIGVGLTLVAWAYAVFDSFRFRAVVGAGHELCTRGPFAHLRHPIYTGLIMLYLGSFLLVPRLLFGLQALINAVAYDYRARVEEGVLAEAFGPDYRHYADHTRRFVPGLY
jgi:protein-S-isoprenylcysteine O-methyltransferase Ste14